MNLQRIMGRVIEMFQNEVTIIHKEKEYDEVYGDVQETTSSIETIAAVNAIMGSEEWNKSGEFTPGDKIFFLRGTETISKDDDIILDGIKYRVAEEPLDHKINNIVQHYECRCRRV
jgi:SPP1 family predicted phage head-tail adaptor